MPKPSWIIIKTTSGSMDGSSQITASAYTGRNNRSGTITGQTTGGAQDTTSVSQSGKTEFITITTVTYSANKAGQTITINGTSNSSDLKIVPGSSTISGMSYKLSVAGKADASWNGNTDIQVDGDPGASAQYNFVISAVVPNNKTTSARVMKFTVKNADEDVTSGEITINQAAGTKSYATPVISAFSYPAGNIAASGGSKTPTLSYSQTWGWNNSTTDGGTLSGTLADPVSGTTFMFDGATNESTGVVTASSKGTTVSGVTQVASVTAQVTLNGKSSAVHAAVTVSQAANAVTYGDVEWTSRTPSIADIPASGGTSGSVSWSGTGAIATQEMTYTSGASVDISDAEGSTTPAFEKITISYGDEVTAASKGTAVSSRTSAGTVTITATGAGSKKATKTVTVYQAANSATYGNVTIDQTTSVSLAPSATTYQLCDGDYPAHQTVTYTSGASRNEKSEDNPVEINISYVIKTSQTGFSCATDTGLVSVTANPTTTQRGGFVVTVTAAGEGEKSLSKDITFNQQGSSSYIVLTPASLSFAAAGETKTLNIESNDSWTLS